MAQHEVIVKELRQLTPSIREFVLVSADGDSLPAYEPGAHIDVDVEGEAGTPAQRAYSLIGGTESADDPDNTYRIAVERAAAGGGGSRFLHDRVALGARLSVSSPRNTFSLDLNPANRLLIGSGIGIAPIYAMVRRLARRELPFALHCLAQDPQALAYREEIARLAGARAVFHDDRGERDNRPDLAGMIAALDYPAHVYVCGARELNDIVVAAAQDNGLSNMQIHAEYFTPAPAVVRDDTGFEVELRRSGVTVYVPPDVSILETLMAAGQPMRFYCGRGECGFCPLPVIEADGPIEHRDHFLTADEKAQDERLCICVSRIKGTRLVLDA
jgi:ferredoxin-NADP reductase